MNDSLKNFLIEILSYVIFGIAWLCYKTSRIEIEGEEFVRQMQESKDSAIFAFWHGRLFPMGFTRPRDKKTFAIISQHTDGEIIARALAKFGVGAIRGSTNRLSGEKQGKDAKDRGGSKALRQTLKILKNSNYLAITPDGPTGPARRFKKNILHAAAQTGTKIYPVSFSCKNAVFFNTWDKFCMPLPFNNIKIIVSKPFSVEKDSDDKQIVKIAKDIEQELNLITDKADYEFNHL